MVVYSAFTRLILSSQPKFVLSFNQDFLQPNLKINVKMYHFICYTHGCVKYQSSLKIKQSGYWAGKLKSFKINIFKMYF